MATGIVPRQGEPTMCEQHCNHHGCNYWREFFASTCPLCGAKFKEGQRFYQIDPGRREKYERVWVHAV